ncbi:hypothetical protein [uncultured Duncaniella sp.]|uniref:hypothetical protein n=1 Tax=uncultured Duncaniella sp. TaxID=2768039 RepID=UPI0026019995|nr:hypothetical protein [uncultured Duncaniella sp.]
MFRNQIQLAVLTESQNIIDINFTSEHRDRQRILQVYSCSPVSISGPSSVNHIRDRRKLSAHNSIRIRFHVLVKQRRTEINRTI